MTSDVPSDNPHFPTTISPVPWLTFIGILALTAVLLIAVMIFMMARTLLRPNRMTDAKAIVRLHRLSPGDLSLRFEDAHFDVRDEQTGRPLRIAAWWIPAATPSAKTMLVI